MSVVQNLIPAETESVILPPTDLYSDEPPLETNLHLRQMLLLIQCLEWLWRDRQDFFVSGNLTIYFSRRKIKSEDFRGPDFFVVLDTERYDRKSWVVWEEEGKYPNLIIELLSQSTKGNDKGIKKEIYQNIFRTPEYFLFDPENLEFQGFLLVGGEYQTLQPDETGKLWSQQLNLFLGIEEEKLRFFTPEGTLVPLPAEEAEQEKQRVEQEKQRVEQEKQRADQERQRADQECQQKEKAEKRLAEMEALLSRYQQQFGDLSEHRSQ